MEWAHRHGRAPRINQDHRTLDGHSRRVHLDEVPSDLEGDLGLAFEGDVAPGIEFDARMRAYLIRAVGDDLDRSDGRDLHLAVGALFSRALGVDVAVSAYRPVVALINLTVVGFLNGLVHVPLHPHIHPPVGVDEHLLLALVVDEAQLVPIRAAAMLRAVRLHGRIFLVLRKFVGRHVVGVVDTTGDDRVVRVATEEIDDHLLTDARHVHPAPVAARPRVRNADPTGAVLVGLPVPIPMELHLHTAVFVGPDFLACLANHHSRLRTVGQRLRRHARRPVRDGGRLRRQCKTPVRGAFASGMVGIVANKKADTEDQILAVLVLARTSLEREPISWRETASVPLPGHRFMRGLQFLQPQFRVVFPVVEVDVAPGPFVDRMVAMRVVVGLHARAQQLRLRLFEVVIVGDESAGIDLLRDLPIVDALLVGNGDTVRRDVRNRVVSRPRLMLAQVVDEHQSVAIHLVLEEIIDALMLHQAAYEIEVRLLILHAVLPLAVPASAKFFLDGKRILAENFVENFRYRLVLKDLEVRLAGQVPQPRPQAGLVAPQVRFLRHLPADERKPRHVSVEESRTTALNL